MSTQIGDLIFESGKTLFEILDALDVPNVSKQLDAVNMRLDDVNDQLRQLGQIVDSNQANNTASFIAVNTQLDSLNSEVTALTLAIAPLSVQVTSLENQVNSLTVNVTNLTNLVNSYNSRITALEASVTSLQQQLTTLNGRVGILEFNAPFSQQLHLGNEYFFSYRTGGVPGSTFFYRITFSGSTSTRILAATGYSAEVLSSQEGTTTQRTVYLAAPFDLFSVTGRFNYPMIQGPCRLSFTVNNTSPLEGYITLI